MEWGQWPQRGPSVSNKAARWPIIVLSGLFLVSIIHPKFSAITQRRRILNCFSKIKRRLKKVILVIDRIICVNNERKLKKKEGNIFILANKKLQCTVAAILTVPLKENLYTKISRKSMDIFTLCLL